MLTDLPVDGVPVMGPGGPFDPDELCLHLLGKVSPRTAYKDDNLKLTWLESEFQTLPDEATEDQLIIWCGARHFTLNPTHVHEFYRDELDVQQRHQEARKAASTLREGVDEMGRTMANNTLDLCRRGLQEAGEVEHLNATLVEDEIAFRERGQDHPRVGGVETPPRAHLATPQDEGFNGRNKAALGLFINLVASVIGNSIIAIVISDS
ncbi:hypothetical protein Acr_05g0008320 [Actinidia rufa]|uniref:Uncharacterized protein n=1 Tax=Actinidia rufa TaxID=165716 RepID=A0A7J0EL51_9ERIC|nr:hypothetical protein Acr_05g0008320 [Actinidia rufa]